LWALRIAAAMCSLPSINSPIPKKNVDCSLTLHVQKDSSGADKESNWLPGAERPDLPSAEDRSAIDPAAGRRYLEATGDRGGSVADRPPSPTAVRAGIPPTPSSATRYAEAINTGG
jgi:hypothetical protein